MQIKPIKTEADYEAALKEIEQLWGSNHGSPEADKLEVLATLVEVYEEEHYPIPRQILLRQFFTTWRIEGYPNAILNLISVRVCVCQKS